MNAFHNNIVCCDVKTNITLSVMMHNTATGLSRIGCSGNYTVKISGGHSGFSGGGTAPLCPLGCGPEMLQRQHIMHSSLRVWWWMSPVS